MSLTTFLNSWKSDPSIAPNISTWQTIPIRQPQFVNFPDDLDYRLINHLINQEIQSLYLHQSQAWELINDGNNIAIVTGTASGKTLAYNLPILQKLLKNSSRRALLIYPTKALAHDQLAVLDAFSVVPTAAYDGDTPQNQRPSIRQNYQIIATNPDMVHLGILPYHTNWKDFFSNLDFVVLDEMHVYRGVFGSHVANVIRRLKRVAAHYGSFPQFILTSATIGNPQNLAQSLVNEPISLISQDYSTRGEKHFLIYNPPIIDQKLGLRASMQRECVRLVSELVDNGYQSILFGRSRRSIEFMLSKLREKSPGDPSSLRAYRSGYLPTQRREIESGLRTGKVKAVTSTTALELGINIGGLDAAVLAGYPGSIAGTWQQAGRSGRNEDSSLSMLVASSNPLDQYLVLHPEFIFSTNPESALIDPDNLLILLNHLQCAAYELPFSNTDAYGNLSNSLTVELLNILLSNQKLHLSNGKYFWMNESYPASDISLRSASSQRIALLENKSNGKSRLIGFVDYESAFWMVHPGAIYLHESDTYRVEGLDIIGNKAYLVPISSDYYTEPERKLSFTIDHINNEENIQGGVKTVGDITITSEVTGYKLINWGQYEVLGREPLDLPSTTLSTSGFWLSLSSELETKLSEVGLWTSSPNDYGTNWLSLREEVLQKDRNKCQVCGKSGEVEPLHIHHKQPLRSFQTIEIANQMSNLISLCPRCHHRVETIVRVNSGIRGLGFVLHSLAPLFLMCDPGDLGVHTDFKSPFGDDRPIVLIFEHIPAGIGYSKSLYNHSKDLLTKAFDLIQNCLCLDGCPSCVGPGGEQGSGSKNETLAILGYLCN